MPPKPKAVCHIETVWIREFARTYLPSEAGLTYAPQHLRDARISLVGIRNVMREGHVVFAAKLDGPGALWVIEDDNNDEEMFRLTVKVITEQLDVNLQKVERVQAQVRAEEHDDGHDAA
jgi:hypothetical protein